MKNILFIFTVTCSVIMLAWGASARRSEPLPKMVRVAIAREARELDLAIDGSFVFRESSGKSVFKGQRMVKSKVRLLDRGILIGGNVYPMKKIIIDAAQDSTIIVNNRCFRGNIVLLRTDQEHMTAVNSINIEDYIKGVLYHEVSHHWPMEALKAQAVAARTYAMYSMSKSTAKDFDVTNDIYSQVYGGKESERYRTGLAVDRTAGEVLTFKGKVLPAYFHATCAGMTEDSKELWDIDLLPLRGVPCDFCKLSPHMSWKRNIRLKEIQDTLNHKGYKIGLIKDISVVSRNRSGRIDTLKIIDRNDKELVIKGKDFREAIGPNLIKSNNFEVVMQGYFVDIIGKGWGHGVGLCQWGAFGMANQQFTYRQILSYYYPHTDLVDYHEFLPVEELKPIKKS